jgi:hypothetical protein
VLRTAILENPAFFSAQWTHMFRMSLKLRSLISLKSIEGLIFAKAMLHIFCKAGNEFFNISSC